MPNDQPTLTLYMHPLSSYCWKVLLALYEAETPFQTVQIDGVPKDNKAYAELWPIAKMPLLQDGHSHAIREAIPTAGIRAKTLIAQEESSQAQGDPDNPDDANADSAGGDNQTSDNGDQGNQPGFAAEPDQNAQSGDNGDNGDPGGDSSASQQDNSTASSDQHRQIAPAYAYFHPKPASKASRMKDGQLRGLA